jgi:HSP20 family protein
MKDLESTIQQISTEFTSAIKKIIPDNNQNKGFIVFADVTQSETEMVITADLPGLTKEQVAIKLYDSVITISGERIIDYDDVSVIKSERQNGRFNKSIKVPQGVKSSDIKASFDKGVLRITIDLTSAKDFKTEIEID